MTAWLLKTEPNAFSWDELMQNQTEPWDGVANNTALMHLRLAKLGEPCLIYHTGTERRVMGLATVVRESYPDPKLDNPKLVNIDVRCGEPLKKPVTLDQMKADPRFAGSRLVREGRLSVVPLSDEQYAAILEMGNG